MSPLQLLLLVSLAALAAADSGGPLLECPGTDWTIYRDQFETSCLKLMPEPKLFPEAFKACETVHARLLSLLHKRFKIQFVNDLIIKSGGENSTLWFFDPLDTHNELVTPGQPPHAPGAEAPWLVISTNPDSAKVELLVNMTAVPRHFICEAPARPAAQRPQFEREPEDVLISEELIHQPAPGTSATSHPPFIITFNCQAFGIPKPTVHWVLVYEVGDKKALTTEAINATAITDPRLLPADASNTAGVIFFNLQRDCVHKPCPTDTIQERSQLIVVNAHLLDLQKRIACLASNDFGSVISREAQRIITKIGNFANATDTVVVKAGASVVVPNPIASDPDAASIECFRAVKTPGAPPIPFEQVNHLTRGGIQLSKAKFDLIVDAAAHDDAGQFICRVRLHNGRLGHTIREHNIILEVAPCVMPDATCDPATKPVAVAAGYPAVLSMNFLSNHFIRAGDDFLLECPCLGKRRPDEELAVEWNLNNKTNLIAQPIPFLLPKNSAMLIRNGEPHVHNGIYQCRCHRGPEASAWSAVQVTILPSPAAKSKEVVHAKPGSSAVLDCSFPALEGADSAVTVTVQPMRGAKPLMEALKEPDAPRFKLARKSATQYSITINDVKETDGDVYGCRVITNYMNNMWLDFNTYYTTLIVDRTRR